MPPRALLIALLVASPLVAKAQEHRIPDPVRAARLAEIDRELVLLQGFDTTTSYRGVSVLFAAAAVLGGGALVASQMPGGHCPSPACLSNADIRDTAVGSLVILTAIPAFVGLVWLVVTAADAEARAGRSRELRRRRALLIAPGSALEPSSLGLRF